MDSPEEHEMQYALQILFVRRQRVRRRTHALLPSMAVGIYLYNMVVIRSILNTLFTILTVCTNLFDRNPVDDYQFATVLKRRNPPS
jgi:hypothetical protein